MKVRFLISAVCIFILISCALKEIVQPPLKPAKVALVLGAGASKGFAHIGVLKVIESNRIPIHMVVGTSAGSFVGSLYAYGYNAFQLQKIAISIAQLSKADVVIKPKVGYIGSADFDKRHEAIIEGEKAAIEALHKINVIITKLKQEGRLE